jgi:hypothetical protein
MEYAVIVTSGPGFGFNGGPFGIVLSHGANGAIGDL